MAFLMIFTRLFPVWATILSLVAYMEPTLFVPFKGFIIPLLSMVMLGMGLTLTIRDFRTVIVQKRAVALGVCLQFLIMPLLAFVLSKVMGLSDDLTIGMVLVGSVAGGTASNVICFLAKGNVPLSITMTSISTLLGVFVTPILVGFFGHKVIDVPVLSMLLSLIKIVLLPVAAGVCVNTFFRRFVKPLTPVFPLFSMLVIIFIIAIVVALNAANINNIGLTVALAVILHNIIGLFLGYFGARLLGFNETICRTVAIEVGMQNSGLAVALSIKYFSSASALPGAIFSIWHNISGSIVASYWSFKRGRECESN